MSVFKCAEVVNEFLFAGKAVITLKSLKSDSHFTYKITPNKNRTVWFVSVLVAADKFLYLGVLSQNQFRIIHTAKSAFAGADIRFSAFQYFLTNVVIEKTIPASLEVRHEGICGRCSRALTHPESIDRGIGPECWNKMMPAKTSSKSRLD
jgi:hypothetical protein